MIIAGLQKQSLIEYPGKISAVIFLAGCNLRCQFCYVPSLVLPERIKEINPIPEKEVFMFLKERKNFLEAVAISGGEPTINKELKNFIKKIKKLNYLVALETNGTNSKMLKELIDKKLIDYVAMDIKQRLNFKKYREICGQELTKKMFTEIKKSIKILISSQIDYEFRTTLVKEFHKKEDIIEICKNLKRSKIYWLQNYENLPNISEKNFTPFTLEEIEEILKEGRKYVNLNFRKYL